MKNLIDQLEKVLKHEEEIYLTMIKISKKKTDVVIEGKVSELEKIIQLEQSLVLKIGEMETEREKIVEEISKVLNMDSSRITLAEIIEKYSNEAIKEVSKTRDNILNLISDLKSLNELNSKLIQNSLDYINFSINVMSSLSTPGELYDNSGEAGNNTNKTFFDVKL